MFDERGGFLQRVVEALDLGIELGQLAFQVAPVGHGLHRRDAQSRGVHRVGMGLALPLRARQRLARGLGAGAGGAGLPRQRLEIGLVLLVPAHLVLQQGQRLGRLRLFAAQAFERFALLGHGGQPGARLGRLGLEILPRLGRLGPLVRAAQFRQAVDIGVQLGHGLRAFVAFRQRARQRVLGFLVRALGPAVARIQQRAALGRHALVQAVAVARGELARQLRQGIAQVRAGVPGRLLEVLALALLDPQQAGDAGEVGLALPARGQFES
ncbi:hypothetical protein LMG1231_05540 [Achromobacter denitrificans]|nr:hypothetical protein LMG1231_05540 [Achromobacter denitrificans]